MGMDVGRQKQIKVLNSFLEDRRPSVVCIWYLLLHNKVPKLKWLKTTINVDYLACFLWDRNLRAA